MPLYEYECEACGHHFEKIRKFSDPPLETCPKCSGKIRKLQSSPAFQFKGSGWYVTDYGKKDAGGEAKRKSDEGSAAKDAASKGEGGKKDEGGKTDEGGKKTETKKADTKEGGSSPSSDSAKPAKSASGDSTS